MSQLAEQLQKRFATPGASIQKPSAAKDWPGKKHKPKAKAAPHPPETAPVTKREKLWEGECIRVNIPNIPQDRDGKHSGGTPYRQCVAGIKGGIVNLHFYHLEPNAKPGTKIVGNVSIWEKTLPDGRRFTYIDCVVVDHAVPVADLLVHSRATEFRRKPETIFGIAVYNTGGAIEVRRPMPKKHVPRASVAAK